jgi:SSS family solute:Na+ symporter
LSKLTTVAWGIAITGFAFIVGGMSETVIEAINKIGSVTFGPILAAFLVGVLSKKAHARGIIPGIVAGVAFNLFLWLGFEDIHWMWWNLFGFLVTSAVALVVSAIITSPQPEDVGEYVLNWSGILKEERRWMVTYALLIFYFLLMLSFMLLLQRLAQ